MSQTTSTRGNAASLQFICGMCLVAALLAADPDPRPIEIGTIVFTDMPDEVLVLQSSLLKGIHAAFGRANREGGAHGRPLQLITREAAWLNDTYVEDAEQFLVDYPEMISFIAMLGTNHATLIVDMLRRNNMLHIGPGSSDMSNHFYTPENVFLRPPNWADVTALTTQLVNKFRFKRIAVEFSVNIPGTDYGQELYEVMTQQLRDLGLEWVYVLRFDWRSVHGDDGTGFNILQEVGSMLLARPEAVVSFGSPDLATATFLLTTMLHPLTPIRAPNLKFFITESLVFMTEVAFAYQELNPAGRVFSTFTYPVTTDTSQIVVQSFHNDMHALYGGNWSLGLVPHAAMPGYIAGRFAAEALRRAANVSRAALFNAVYSSGIFEVDDSVYGIFKAECRGARRTGCNCNQGANRISLGMLRANYTWEAVEDATFEWDVSVCGGEGLQVVPTTNYLQLLTEDTPRQRELRDILLHGKLMAEAMVASGLVGGLQQDLSSVETHIVPLRTQPAVAAQVISDTNRSLLVTAVAHSTIGDADTPWPLLDPYSPVANLSREFDRNVLHIHLTLEQELHAAAFHVGAGRRLWLIAPVDRLGAFRFVAARSCETFGASLSTAEMPLQGDGTAGAAAVAAALTAAGASDTIFLAGLQEPGEAAAVMAGLAGQPTLQIIIPSAEFFALFSAFAEDPASAAASVAQRLLVITNLPHWGAASAESGIIGSYYAQLRSQRGPNATAHPLEVRSFIATRAFQVVLDSMPRQRSPTALLRTWYFLSTVSVDSEVVLGPFFDTPCADAPNPDACECNRGARVASVFSLGGVLPGGSSRAPLTSLFFDSCRIRYTTTDGNTGLNLGVVVGIVVAAIVIVGALGVVAARFGSKSRDTRNAPTDPNKPVSLVFTDIQSSTSLWARIPEQMGPALDTHHELIRQLIRRHRGYEVKTVGDAFMIAFESADDAVELCEALQTTFFAHDWGTNAIDETYRQLEQEALEEDAATDRAPTCRMPAALYAKSWNGLRVRCGIHTGLADIKFDEVTLGYDYYGGTSNTAARVESVANGGQVLLSRAAAAALGRERALTNLGAVALRGVTGPVELLQLDAVSGRSFAPLRLDEQDRNDDDGMVSCATGGEASTGSEARSSVAETRSMSGISTVSQKVDNCNLRHGISVLLSSMDEALRRDTLRAIAGKWRLTVPHERSKRKEISALLDAISGRVLSVIEVQQRQRAAALGFGPGSATIGGPLDFDRVHSFTKSNSSDGLPRSRPQSRSGFYRIPSAAHLREVVREEGPTAAAAATTVPGIVVTSTSNERCGQSDDDEMVMMLGVTKGARADGGRMTFEEDSSRLDDASSPSSSAAVKIVDSTNKNVSVSDGNVVKSTAVSE